jgi:thiamine monophosphate kinase
MNPATVAAEHKFPTYEETRGSLRWRGREGDDYELVATWRVPDPQVAAFDTAHMRQHHHPALIGCHERGHVARHGQHVSRGQLQDDARDGP